MKKLFDDSFWRMLSGFIIIVTLSILFLVVTKGGKSPAAVSEKNTNAHSQTK